MADTTYNVRVKYNLDKSKAEADANSLANTFDRLAKVIGGAFAVHRLMDFGARIVKLQSEAEQFRLTMATMLTGFGAPGFADGAKDFQKAMSASQQLMMQIRLDAAKLPGTAEELMEVMRATMPGALGAGKAIMGSDSAYEMSKRLMAASTLLNIPGGVHTVSREFMAIMEGRTIGRNDLFARLKPIIGQVAGHDVNAKEMNQMTEPERFRVMGEALKRLVDPALPTFATTWKAISTTTLNWAQQLARVVTASPYKVLVEHLKQFNDWVQRNQASIEQFAMSIGDKLGSALSSAFSAIKSTFEFIVQNKDTILTIAKVAGIALLGGQVGFTGKSVGSTLAGNAGLGLMLNSVTGGNMATGGIMALFSMLASFGGALGTASFALVAFAAAANAAAEAVDKSHKDEINRGDGTNRLGGFYDRYRTGGADSVYANVKQIIQANGLMSSYGSIDESKYLDYIRKDTDIAATFDPNQHSAARHLLGMFKDVASMMRDRESFGPRLPTADEKAFAELYKAPVPRKADVNVNVTIKQDISMADDPDRIRVMTTKALEDALIRPIESGNNRFGILR